MARSSGNLSNLSGFYAFVLALAAFFQVVAKHACRIGLEAERLNWECDLSCLVLGICVDKQLRGVRACRSLRGLLGDALTLYLGGGLEVHRYVVLLAM